MFQQCVSESFQNYLFGNPNWSDKCIEPWSDPSLLIVAFILLSILGIAHKLPYYFFKETKLFLGILNNFSKLSRLGEEQDSDVDFSLLGLLKIIIFIVIALLYITFFLMGSIFLADFILTYFGYPEDVRYTINYYLLLADILPSRNLD